VYRRPVLDLAGAVVERYGSGRVELLTTAE
jgi:hypothetical protein